MKLVLTFAGFLTCSFAFSQKIPLNKLWVGNANNYFEVDSDAVRVECYEEYRGKMHGTKHAYSYSIINDTLHIIDHDLYGCTKQDFIIKSLTEDELILVPLCPTSRLLAFKEIPEKILTYQSQQKIFTDTIHFEKLFFSSTTCYGFCPAMLFQIDNKKQMNFSGGKLAVKEGFFTAVLTEQLYDELLKTLAISDLDKLEDPEKFNIDAPTYTLEVHYNNKVKFIKSAFFPYVANELLGFLLRIPKRVELKDAKPMEILFSK
jgi:hypothetical protein